MSRIKRLSLATAASGAAVCAFAGAAQAAVHHVKAGHSIQRAVNHAKPGDTVLVAQGVYHQTVVIRKSVTLRGAGGSVNGTVLRPSSHACPKPNAANCNGIVVFGSPQRRVSNVKITGFLLDGYPGFGMIGFGDRNITVADSTSRGNGGYGFANFNGVNVSFLRNVSHSNGEPGFYIGDSLHSNARVIGNLSYGNQYGFFLRDSSNGVIRNNISRGNCVGMLFLNTGEPNPVANWRASENTVVHNDKVCPPDDEGAPQTTGTGIALAGTRHVLVTRNIVRQNRPAAAAPFAGGVVVFSSKPFGGADPVNNVVTVNAIQGNRPADIVYDRSGHGNRFFGNACSSSRPKGLC